MFSCDMASRWRELHGSGHWDGLLDPLDVDLRRCLITYGEMIMATYEAFIGEHRSPNAGMCRYRRADLFRRVDVSHPGWYAATRYIYATANADVHGKVLLRPLCREGRATECNWMGYVAVATDEAPPRSGGATSWWRGAARSARWSGGRPQARARIGGRDPRPGGRRRDRPVGAPRLPVAVHLGGPMLGAEQAERQDAGVRAPPCSLLDTLVVVRYQYYFLRFTM